MTNKVFFLNENLDIEEASYYLKMKKSTLYKWVHQKKIPFRKHGGRLIFNKQSLEEWSQKREVPEID